MNTLGQSIDSLTPMLEVLRTINVALSALTLAALYIRINSRWDHLHAGVRVIYTGILFFPFGALIGSIQSYLIKNTPTLGTGIIFIGCVITLLGLIVTSHLGSDALGAPGKRRSTNDG